MDYLSLATFALALFVAAVAPGPGIAAIVARVLGRGRHGAFAFTAGMAIGDVVWLTMAIFGLAALAQAFQGAFLAVKYAGAAYLLYLGWKLWTSSPESIAVSEAPQSRRLFLGGLAVTMGNPKTMVFYLALLPSLIDLARITWVGYVELAAVTLLVLAVVFWGYVILADRARQTFRNPKALRLINRGTGAVMAGAAAAVAAR